MFAGLFGDDEVDGGHSSSNTTSASNRSNNKRMNLRKPTEKRSPHGFVGLMNQGATCYLNSLIQLLYMTPELKDKLYSLTLEDFGLETNEENKDSAVEDVNIETMNTTTTTTTTTTPTTTSTTTETTTNLSSINGNFERPSNPSIAIKSSQQQKEQKQKQQAKRQQEEEEFDYSILESDYFANLMSFGFPEHKLIEGLKKFPHEHQQESLVDWILSYDDRMISDDLITTAGDIAPLDPGTDGSSFGPLTKEQQESLDNLPLGDSYFPLKNHDEERSAQSDVLDAFFDSSPTNNSQAIVLYDENQSVNLFSDVPLFDAKEIAQAIASSSYTPTTTNTNSTSATKSKKKGRRISYELQRLFALLQAGDVNAVSTEDLTRSFGWYDSQSLQQHDIHELNRILFDAIEHSIKNTPIENVFNELYKGSFLNKIVCSKCNSAKEITEHYLDIPISVKNINSVQESLDAFVKPDILEGKNMYFCESCNEKVVATFTQRIGKLPPVLHMHLNRFDYDFQKGKRIKIHNRLEFPNQINMTVYTDEYETYQKALDKATKENPDKTEEILKSLQHLKPADRIYELFGVVIHSGGAFGGHYHSYIKDLLSSGKIITESLSQKDEEFSDEKDKLSAFNNDNFTNWFDFNDSSVFPIKDKTIINQFGGKSECAYMLIYRDKAFNSKESLDFFKDKTIPEHFKKEIDRFNVNIERQRNTYEKTINTMYLYPKFQSDFLLKDGFLMENEKIQNELEELESDHLTIQIDIASTVDDLFALIDQKYPEHVASMGGPKSYVIQEISIKNKQITSFQSPIEPGSSLNIKKTGLREGSQIIIWKGEEQSGLPLKPIHYQIKYYSLASDPLSPPQTKIFNLAIGKDSTFTDLENQISNLLFLSPSSLSIYTTTPTGVLLLENDPSLPLQNRIHQGILLLVEETPKGTIDSLVIKDYELNKNKIQIFVKDRVSSPESKEAFKVLVDIKSTLFELKSIILDSIPKLEKNEWLNRSIIRKTIVGGYEGTAVTDDSMILKEAGIFDSSMVIIEVGTPTKSSITVRYLFFKDKINIYEHSGPSSITVPKTITLIQLKRDMVKQMGMSEEYTSRYILRACDLFEKPTHIISDEDQSLEESGITTSDVIAIEEGILPNKDQIPLHIRVYQCSKESIQLQFPSSPILHLNPTYIPQIPDLYTIRPIGTILTDRKQNLLSLKKEILKWDKFQEAIKDNTLQFIPETEDIRLWLDERLLTSYNKSLSKIHGIQSESTLTIEVCQQSQNELLEQNNTDTKLPPLLLYVHKRRPDVQCFDHPAKQIIFKGKLISELIKQVSFEFEIAEEFVKLYKFSPNQKTNPWKIVEERSSDSPAMNGTTSKSREVLAPVNELPSSISINTLVDEPKGHFGVTLESLMNRQILVEDLSSNKVPVILIAFMNKLAMLQATEIKDVFSDQSVSCDILMTVRDIIDLNPSELHQHADVYLVAALFKQWLRELPYPLISTECYHKIIVQPDKAWEIIQATSSPVYLDSLNYILDFLLEFTEPDHLSLDLAQVLLRSQKAQNEDDIYKAVLLLESIMSSKNYNQLNGVNESKFDNINNNLGKNNQITNQNNNTNIPPPPPPLMKKKEAITNKNKTNSNEIRGKPYLLKDGDILSMTDSREDPEGLDKFAMSVTKESFSTRYSKSGGEKYSVYGPKQSTYKPREVNLTIELDDY